MGNKKVKIKHLKILQEIFLTRKGTIFTHFDIYCQKTSKNKKYG